MSMKININSNGLSNRNLGVHTDIKKRIFKNEKEEKVFPIVEMQLINVEGMIRSDQSSVMSDSLRPHESQHARPPCPSPTPGVHSDSGPSSQ